MNIDLRRLWLTQVVATPTIDLDDIKQRAAKFERSVKWRNVREWIAVAVVVPVFARMAYNADNDLARAGAVWIALAAVFIGIHLWRFGRAQAPPEPTIGTIAYGRAHVEVLRAQSNLLRRVPVWYLGPIAVGLALRLAGTLPEGGKGAWLVAVGICVVVVVGVCIINQRAAAELERKAAALLRELAERNDGKSGGGGVTRVDPSGARPVKRTSVTVASIARIPRSPGGLPLRAGGCRWLRSRGQLQIDSRVPPVSNGLAAATTRSYTGPRRD